MSAVNSVLLIGRLVADVELKNNETRSWARGRVAVARTKKDEADFFNFVVFGQPAEYLSNYAKKGHMISIQGEIQNSQYTNKEGNTVNTVEIIAQAVSIVNSPRNSDSSADNSSAEASRGPQQDRNRRSNQPQRSRPQATSSYDIDEFEDEE